MIPITIIPITIITITTTITITIIVMITIIIIPINITWNSVSPMRYIKLSSPAFRTYIASFLNSHPYQRRSNKIK